MHFLLYTQHRKSYLYFEQINFELIKQVINYSLTKTTLTLCISSIFLLITSCDNNEVYNFKTYRDCFECPEMAIIPSNIIDKSRSSSLNDFDISIYEITYKDWGNCVESDFCDEKKYFSIADENYPISSIQISEIQQYLNWLKLKTGINYRLPTDEEWEFSARANTKTKYWWGNKPSRSYANYGKEKIGTPHADGADKWMKEAPVGSFPPNPFGLYDMNGNISEYVQFCKNEYYYNSKIPCLRQVVRGGNYINAPELLVNSFRLSFLPGTLPASPQFGFRIAKSRKR